MHVGLSHSFNFLIQVMAAAPSGLLQQGSLCDDALSAIVVWSLCTVFLLYRLFRELVGVAQITLFIPLDVLLDVSVHTRSHDQFYNLIG